MFGENPAASTAFTIFLALSVVTGIVAFNVNFLICFSSCSISDRRSITCVVFIDRACLQNVICNYPVAGNVVHCDRNEGLSCTGGPPLCS